ncbi:MAG: septal ring lytic transglycosylase RlpA family protein [Kovacikia sp.]
MPIFGLVWVASWVGCFFPSSQDLLQAPSYPSCVLANQSPNVRSFPGRDYSTSVSIKRPLVTPQPVQTSFETEVKRVEVGEVSSFSILSLLDIFSSVQAVTAQTILRSGPDQSPRVAPKSLPESLLKAFNHFFQVAALPSSSDRRIAVSQVQVDSPNTLEDKPSRGIGFGQCSALPRASTNAGLQKPEWFQVRVGGAVLGEFSTPKQAKQVTQRLERFLHKPTPNPVQIQPVLLQGEPAIKWGDRLFVLDKELTQSMNCNPELLAIQWVNNLRLALNQPVLELDEAQETMYGLQPTDQTIEGTASWYGPYFNGRQTATGETFDEREFTAAHPSLPFDTYLKVINLHNGRSVIVRINDRGPYFDNRNLDLSREAARSLESEETGVVPFEAVIMKPMKAGSDSPGANKIATDL